MAAAVAVRKEAAPLELAAAPAALAARPVQARVQVVPLELELVARRAAPLAVERPAHRVNAGLKALLRYGQFQGRTNHWLESIR